MSRITDKIIRPIPLPGETKVREQPKQRELPVPDGARVAGVKLTPEQKAGNEQLIALYHSLVREKKPSPSTSEELKTRLKGWKQRPPGKKKRDQDSEEDNTDRDEDEQA